MNIETMNRLNDRRYASKYMIEGYSIFEKHITEEYGIYDQDVILNLFDALYYVHQKMEEFDLSCSRNKKIPRRLSSISGTNFISLLKDPTFIFELNAPTKERYLQQWNENRRNRGESEISDEDEFYRCCFSVNEKVRKSNGVYPFFYFETPYGYSLTMTIATLPF